MKNGDISNELPKRVIVLADTFFKIEYAITKTKFKVFKSTEKKAKVDRALLSRLYLFSQNIGYTLELASFTLSDEDLQELVDKLDHMGTNPFRYFTHYDSIDRLVTELPYRPEVIGVLDLPERMLRYGHWGLDFKQL